MNDCSTIRFSAFIVVLFLILKAMHFDSRVCLMASPWQHLEDPCRFAGRILWFLQKEEEIIKRAELAEKVVANI